MGQNLCCLRPPNTNSDSFKHTKGGLSSEVEATVMTLGDHMLKSPALNNYPINGHSKRPAAADGDETDHHRQVFKQPVKKKRVLDGSSPDNLSDGVFYTPRMSFSSSGKLEKIDELLGEDDDDKKKKNTNSCGVRSILISTKGSRRRVVVEKKVDFMLPGEHEPRRDFIRFYSPRETFDC